MVKSIVLIGLHFPVGVAQGDNMGCPVCGQTQECIVDYGKFDDQTLLRLMSHADEAALSELYDRYSRLVYSMALNSLGDPSLAEEVTQDVFYRVWANAGSYNHRRAQVSTWLVSITRNRAIDEIRRVKVRPESNHVPWEAAGRNPADGAMDVESKVELSQRQFRVRSAIAQLPEEQRQALAYAYFQGYSHREIAELLDLPLGTVKTRIRLSMQKLKTIILEDESAITDPK